MNTKQTLPANPSPKFTGKQGFTQAKGEMVGGLIDTATSLGTGIASMIGGRRDRKEARAGAMIQREDEIRSRNEWDVLAKGRDATERRGQDVSHLARTRVLQFDSYMRELQQRQKKFTQTNEAIQQIGQMANESEGMRDVMFSLLGGKKEGGQQ